jgi:hypothetical protein
MNYILHSHLFKFNASVDIILRQSHDITVNRQNWVKILQVNSQNALSKKTTKMSNKLMEAAQVFFKLEFQNIISR